MALFGRKGPYDIDSRSLGRSSHNADGSRRKLVPEGATTPEGKRLTLLLVFNTLIAVAIYFGCVALEFIYMMYIYVGLGAALLIVYVIYNRGFSLRGVTPDMLPDTLTPEQKQQRLDEAARRLHESRWMLTLIIPLILAVLLDVLYLFFVADLLAALGARL